MIQINLSEEQAIALREALDWRGGLGKNATMELSHDLADELERQLRQRLNPAPFEPARMAAFTGTYLPSKFRAAASTKKCLKITYGE